MFQVQRRAPGSSAWRVLFWWSTVVALLRWYFVVFYRYRRHGMEHVPKTGAVLLVSNHQSNLDPPLVGFIAIDRPFKSIARESLFSSSILGYLMRTFGAISIRRGESDTKAIRAAIAELHAGGSVMIFPEGTRSVDGRIGTFQRGLWLLIRRSDAMILPVGIEGAFDVWPIGSKLKHRGWIEAQAGKPISCEELIGLGEDAGMELVKSRIEELRLQCRARIDMRSMK